MICRRCGYRYVLDPKRPPRIGDRTVLRAGARIGANGRPFTVNQLIGAVTRRRRWYLGITTSGRRRRFDAMGSAIGRLEGARALHGLVTRPRFGSSAPTSWNEPDLFDYGAERLLVVDEYGIVDLLVSCDVHLAAKALVLSVDGYPAHVLALARRLVGERPDIPVFVLHAAGSWMDGAVADRARALLGATSSTPILDLGLDVDAAKRIRSLRWARGVLPLPADCLPNSILVGGLTRAMVEGTRLGTVDDGGSDPWWRVFDDDYG